MGIYSAQTVSPGRMITLTRLNDSKVVVNAELIEFVEALPDTIVTLTTGQKFMVKESVDNVVELVTDYKRSIHTAVAPKRG